MPFLLVLGAAYYAHRVAEEKKKKQQQEEAENDTKGTGNEQQGVVVSPNTGGGGSASKLVYLSLLPDEKEISIFELPIATITIYNGNYTNVVDYLQKERIPAILQANPWLVGSLQTISKKSTDADTEDSELMLVYNESVNVTNLMERNDHENCIFQVFSEGLFDINKTPYNEIGTLLSESNVVVKETIDLIDTINNETTDILLPPLWKVSILPIQPSQQSAEQDPTVTDCGETKDDVDATTTTTGNNSTTDQFMMVVSMSHTIGDAFTYYKVFKMLDYNSEIEILNPIRRTPSYNSALEKKLGIQQTNYMRNLLNLSTASSTTSTTKTTATETTILAPTIEDSLTTTNTDSNVEPEQIQQPISEGTSIVTAAADTKNNNNGDLSNNVDNATASVELISPTMDTIREEKIIQQENVPSNNPNNLVIVTDHSTLNMGSNNNHHHHHFDYYNDSPIVGTNPQDHTHDRPSMPTTRQSRMQSFLSSPLAQSLFDLVTDNASTNNHFESTVLPPEAQNEIQSAAAVVVAAATTTTTTKMVTKLFYINEDWVMQYRNGSNPSDKSFQQDRPPTIEESAELTPNNENNSGDGNDGDADEITDEIRNMWLKKQQQSGATKDASINFRVSQLFEADNISESVTTVEFVVVESLASIVDDSEHAKLKRIQSFSGSSSSLYSLALDRSFQNDTTTTTDSITVTSNRSKLLQHQHQKYRFSVTPTTTSDTTISANSIISSWFFTINETNIGFCMINLRNRLFEYGCNVNNLDAGNYVNAITFTPKQYVTPEHIQQCVNSLNRSGQASTSYQQEATASVPQLNHDKALLSSMSVNWANFYREEIILHPTVTQYIHYPLYTSDVLSTKLPNRVSAINLFTASCSPNGKRRAGAFVLCTEKVWNEHIVNCGIIDEMIADQ